MVSGLSFSFLVIIRNGRGSLQVMIAGSGSLLSILTAGGVTTFSEIAVDCFLKILGREDS